VDSFAYESRDPEGMDEQCEISHIALRTLSDRDDRPWNAYDWRRVGDKLGPPSDAINLGSEEGGSLPEQTANNYTLEWDAGRGTLSRSGDAAEVLANGTRDEIVKLAPGWRDLIEADIHISFEEIKSRDGRFASVSRSFRDDNRGKWQMIQSGPFLADARSSSSISFLEGLSTFAIRDRPCGLTFVRVPDGKLLGRVATAYEQLDQVTGVAGDLVFVVTSGRRDARSSIQIFDFPALNSGPWLITGNWLTSNENLEYGSDQTLPLASNKQPLIPFERKESRVSEDGHTVSRSV
jgi:hypothetical protein